MSTSRRRDLAGLARRHGLLLIEDAAYAFLVKDAPPPLASLAPDLTVYVSGVSKSIATGLRVGFVAAPAELVPRLQRAIRATTWNTPGVMTALACRWLQDGTVTRLEAHKRKDAAARQALARKVLAPLKVIGHPASYFCWLPLEEGVRADQVALALMKQHVSVSTAEPYGTSSSIPHALRLALGSVERKVLEEALVKVRGAIAGSMPGPLQQAGARVVRPGAASTQRRPLPR